MITLYGQDFFWTLKNIFYYMTASSVGKLNGILCSRLASYPVRWVCLTAWDFLLSFCEKKKFFFLSQKKYFQLVLWASISHILLAQGRLFLILVNNFVRGWLAWTLVRWSSVLQKLLAQQEYLLVQDYQTGLFSSPVGHIQ